jgi:glycosyltransferase involved in cell wall biosynthesis
MMVNKEEGLQISVVIAVYNGEKCIRDCLESLKNQTYLNYEIIIVNDGSEDDTVRMIEPYLSERVLLINFKSNRGVSKARNEAVKKAKGKYIAILDADDIALPERLEKQLEFFNINSSIDLVGSYYKLSSEMGYSGTVKRPLCHKAILKKTPIFCPISNTTIMVKRKTFLDVGGYPEHLNHGEDYRFFVNCLINHFCANIPSVLVEKRETKKGLTFKLSALEHFKLGWAHRRYAISKLKLPLSYHLLAFIVSLGIFFFRCSSWINREKIRQALT